jgi:hypothetical protein
MAAMVQERRREAMAARRMVWFLVRRMLLIGIE